jgi:hypothetical protein
VFDDVIIRPETSFLCVGSLLNTAVLGQLFCHSNYTERERERDRTYVRSFDFCDRPYNHKLFLLICNLHHSCTKLCNPNAILLVRTSKLYQYTLMREVAVTLYTD